MNHMIWTLSRWANSFILLSPIVILVLGDVLVQGSIFCTCWINERRLAEESFVTRFGLVFFFVYVLLIHFENFECFFGEYCSSNLYRVFILHTFVGTSEAKWNKFFEVILKLAFWLLNVAFVLILPFFFHLLFCLGLLFFCLLFFVNKGQVTRFFDSSI